MEFEYRCHQCGKKKELDDEVVFALNGTGMIFCPSKHAPLEEGSCAFKFVENYVRDYPHAKEELMKRSYVFARLGDLVES